MVKYRRKKLSQCTLKCLNCGAEPSEDIKLSLDKQSWITKWLCCDVCYDAWKIAQDGIFKAV